MTDFVYPKYKRALGGGTGAPITLLSDPIYVLLVTNTYVGGTLATIKLHEFRSDIATFNAASEVVGTNYTTGGIQLTSPTITAESGTDNYIFDAADASWASATITARGAVVYKRVGADLSTPADDPLIALFDFTADKTSTGGTFTIQWATLGLLRFA